MSLILRLGWVWTLEKYVTKFFVTNWEGRVGLDPNMYDVTNFSLFFLKASLNKRIENIPFLSKEQDEILTRSSGVQCVLLYYLRLQADNSNGQFTNCDL